MLGIGDIHVYVSDFDAGLRFWAEGLGLSVAERQSSRYAASARLDFPDGGPSLRLLAPVAPWAPGTRPEPGTLPGVAFDVTTDQFDAVLVRLLERGGRQESEIEAYEGLRMVTLADPDGNAFDLIEVPADERP
ncbi:MAG: VOC family protein [Phycisphaerae bacterium]|jgi:catechol 2,3-dioxygenase-like lactoylglutathione lyase family enzyme